jgi:hypothetical protein
MFDFILLVSAVIFVILDFVYLNVIKGYFNNQIKSVQGSPIQINYLGAALCYILLIVGINYFIINIYIIRKMFFFTFIIHIIITI